MNGKQYVTPSKLLWLVKEFGTTPEFWLNGQIALEPYF